MKKEEVFSFLFVDRQCRFFIFLFYESQEQRLITRGFLARQQRDAAGGSDPVGARFDHRF